MLSCSLMAYYVLDWSIWYLSIVITFVGSSRHTKLLMLPWRVEMSRSYGRWACDCHSEVAWFRSSAHGPIHKAWSCINHCICRAMVPRDPFFPPFTWWDDDENKTMLDGQRIQINALVDWIAQSLPLDANEMQIHQYAHLQVWSSSTYLWSSLVRKFESIILPSLFTPTDGQMWWPMYTVMAHSLLTFCCENARTFHAHDLFTHFTYKFCWLDHSVI